MYPGITKMLDKLAKTNVIHKNKANNPERMELKKYCPWCRKHTVHKETR